MNSSLPNPFELTPAGILRASPSNAGSTEPQTMFQQQPESSFPLTSSDSESAILREIADLQGQAFMLDSRLQAVKYRIDELQLQLHKLRE